MSVAGDREVNYTLYICQLATVARRCGRDILVFLHNNKHHC